jgi:hypothetical protein
MTASENPENLVRHCPKCGSVRVHQSRRRGPIDRVLAALGGAICRCHDCCARQAWFGFSPVPIGNKDPEAPAWAGIALIGSACAGFALVWWVVTRLTERIF